MQTAILENLISSAIAYGAAWADAATGRHSGELSARQARKVYGKWFTTAVNAGRLHPSRVEDKRHIYSVQEILALKVKEAAHAEINFKQSKI